MKRFLPQWHDHGNLFPFFVVGMGMFSVDGDVWWGLCWNSFDGLGGSQILYVMKRYLEESVDDGRLSEQGVQSCGMCV